ncbi:hypothetical protein ACFJIX_26755 [Roseateles sp. UC29_93]|uniref:hypothetical protein n=1 Tax=Roseateles sp. UC29_93 TaxID=3350177 RepID=UPI003673248A
MSTAKYLRAIRTERNSSFKTAILLSSLAIGAGLMFSAVQEARGATPVTDTFPVTVTSARMVSDAHLSFGSAIPSPAGVVPGCGTETDTDSDTAP